MTCDPVIKENPRKTPTSEMDCKNICSEDDRCKFVFYIPTSPTVQYCLKYGSCEKLREAKNPGSTYSKDGKCPGRNFRTF